MSNKKEETLYRLKIRVKELEREATLLRKYRNAFRDVFSVACDCADSNSTVKNSYILRKAKEIME